MKRLLPTMIALLVSTSQAWSDDVPVVSIRDGGLHPPALDVHVGEIVRWQALPGQRIRVQLDDHPSAHEVAERPGEVHAIFRKAGKHTYVVTILSTGERLRGSVTVGDPRRRPAGTVDCAEGSSDRICFAP